MYHNKLAVALKSAGKVLREFGDNVYIPFASEYSIFIKNMNSVRALVSVTVDGTDVGDGTKFVVNANSSIDIERFIKNGNLDEGNRLKFIERSDAVEQYRGVGVEDGLVRVEFQFERKPVTPLYDPDKWTVTKKGGPLVPHWGANPFHYDTSNTIDGGATFCATAKNTVDHGQDIIRSVQANDVGITVAGSRSEQQFKQTSSFAVESETHVIVLKILGETADNKEVRTPVTVKTRLKCTTCGTVNKATSKFCSQCGTALQII